MDKVGGYNVHLKDTLANQRVTMKHNGSSFDNDVGSYDAMGAASYYTTTTTPTARGYSNLQIPIVLPTGFFSTSTSRDDIAR